MIFNINTFQPVGNFDTILQNVRKKADLLITENAYSSRIAELMKFNFEIADSLKLGIKDNDCWDINEAIQCLIYSMLINIDLNNAAHKCLNNIEVNNRLDELRDYLHSNKDIFPHWLLTEDDLFIGEYKTN